MNKKLIASAILTAALSTTAFASSGGDEKHSDDIRKGGQVYQQDCAVCHMPGSTVKKALKFGSKKDWAPLIEEGQQFPVAHGWIGTRQMPPHGGNKYIKFEEFINAVAFMGNAAGANWQEYDKLDKKLYKEMLKEIEIRILRNMVYDSIKKPY